MAADEKSKERFDVNPDDYENFYDLPVVHTGCDSYASWDPRFKKFATMYTEDELAERVHNELLPYNEWFNGRGQNVHVILTGGEPLLPGWQKFWVNYLQKEIDRGLSYITFETNGTQKLSKDMKALMDTNNHVEFTFSVAAKLSNSGEPRETAIQPETVAEYDGLGEVFLKFVTQGEEDMPEILDTVDQYHSAGGPYPVYLMPVGGTDKLYYESCTPVANLALKHGFKYSPRLQIDLWGNVFGS